MFCSIRTRSLPPLRLDVTDHFGQPHRQLVAVPLVALVEERLDLRQQVTGTAGRPLPEP